MQDMAAEGRNHDVRGRIMQLRGLFLTWRERANYDPRTQMHRKIHVQVLLIAAVCLVMAHPAFAGLPHRASHAIHKEIEALEQR